MRTSEQYDLRGCSGSLLQIAMRKRSQVLKSSMRRITDIYENVNCEINFVKENYIVHFKTRIKIASRKTTHCGTALVTT